MLFASLFLAFLGCAAPTVPTPPPSAALDAAIDAVVRDEMEANHVPGAAVVVVRDGQTVFQRGYGVADVETGRPVDPERTLFRIGSISKALTGLALTRLVDDGRLDWSTPASDYTDAIDDRSGSDSPVTLRHLLTHTAGFDQVGVGRQIGGFEMPLAERKSYRPDLGEWLEDGNLRRVRPPGRWFVYDTYGVSLAGLILGRATGQSYAEAMRRELFEPLGMDDSFVEVEEARFGDLAVGYGWADGAYQAQPYELYTTLPASAIDATPADMGRLLEALTGGGANAHGRLFSAEAAASVLAPQFRPHPDFAGVTHGFWEAPATPDGAAWTVEHGGTMRGYTALLAIYPEDRTAVFVVGNRDAEAGGGWVALGSRVSEVVREHLVDAAPRGPFRPPVERAIDFAPYEGTYAEGMYCRTCTDDEFALGAWRRRGEEVVRGDGGRLHIGQEVYLPTADDDVFVREDGGREVFFGRDGQGRVSFIVSSRGPRTLERILD